MAFRVFVYSSHHTTGTRSQQSSKHVFSRHTEVKRQTKTAETTTPLFPTILTHSKDLLLFAQTTITIENAQGLIGRANADLIDDLVATMPFPGLDDVNQMFGPTKQGVAGSLLHMAVSTGNVEGVQV